MADLRGLVGPLEHDVLQVLWERGGDADVATVRAGCNADREAQDALAYTTIMTVLSRLHDKGLVTRDRAGRGYRYTPRFDPDELVAHLSARDVDHLLERYGEVALARFAEALETADPQLRARVEALAREDDRA